MEAFWGKVFKEKLNRTFIIFEALPTILAIIFRNFTTISADLQQVKQNLISSITDLVWVVWRVVWEFVWIHSSVSLPDNKLWQHQSKSIQNKIAEFSCPFQFYWISLLYFKYFAHSLHSKKNSIKSKNYSQCSDL